jgi:hypothetical protein
MEIIQAYAVAVGGVFGIYFLIAILSYLMPFIERLLFWLLNISSIHNSFAAIVF